MARPTVPLLERYTAKVERRRWNQCWPWRGGHTSDGYGIIRRGPHAEGVEYAHRLAWMFNVGPIPDGLTIDHKCFNRGLQRRRGRWEGFHGASLPFRAPYTVHWT